MVQWRSIPFILIFPGYFIYGWSGLNEWTPMLLGGYLNEMSAIVCLGFIFGWLLRPLIGLSVSKNWNILDIFFMMFMAWFAGVMAVNFVLSTAPGVTKNHFGAWIQMSGCYLVARNSTINKMQKTLLLLTLLCVAFVVWAAQADFIALLFANKDLKGGATYQGLARALLISSVFCMFGIKSRQVRLVFYLLVLVAIFFLGARSEIIGGLTVFLMFEILISQRPIFTAVIVVCVSAVLAIFVIGSLDELGDIFPDNRFIAFLLQGNDDGSLVERAYLKQLGLMAISENPWFGSYGHYEKEVSAGAYMHNWLGAWVDLGIVGLLLYVGLHFAAGIYAIRKYLKASVDEVQIERRSAALGVSLIVMIAVFDLFAKNFSDTGLATVVGYISSLTIINSYEIITDSQSAT